MSELVAATLYPLKGGRGAKANGQSISRLTVTPKGLQYQGVSDRQLYIAAPRADGADGLMVVTPRGQTKPHGPPHRHSKDRAIKRIEVDIVGQQQVRLAAAGIGAVALDLSRPVRGAAVPAALHIGEVWGHPIGEAAEFVREVTGRPQAALMQASPMAVRSVGPGGVRDMLAADSRPFSFCNAQSLTILNDKKGSAVPAIRYRANFEADELDGPFSEHAVRRMAIDSVPFQVAAGIVRCVVVNMDEEGAMTGGGLSLLQERKGVRVDGRGVPESIQPEPIFCVSLTPQLAPGEQPVIAVGAPVEVLEWGEPNILIVGAQG